MLYITGDCHAKWGEKFSTGVFPEQKEMTREDFVIVCGDFGIWHDNKTERWWLDWLADKPFTLCFVDGNHENFDRLYSDEFEMVDFHGGKAHKIRDNIYHLMRGYIFEICDKKIFAFGGASSHDIQDGILDRENFVSEEEFKDTVHEWYTKDKWFRINHMSWWKQELPNEEEMEFGRRNLKEHDNRVDFIVSHCCPQRVASAFSNGSYKADQLTNYFNEIDDSVEFTKWFFGHYHDNAQILGKYHLLYEQIVRVV